MFEVGDHVFFKISPIKGVLLFDNQISQVKDMWDYLRHSDEWGKLHTS